MSSRDDSSSPRSKGTLSAIGDKISKALTKDPEIPSPKEEPLTLEGTAVGKDKSRSVSRGRESLASYSTGRGGAGNVVRSPSRGVGPLNDVDTPSPYEQQVLKERAEAGKYSPRARSTGRGGLGNVRSPSLDGNRPSPDSSTPPDVSPVRGREGKPGSPAGVFSTGRGGAGNMRSRSRDTKELLQTIAEPPIERQNRHERD